MRTYEMMFILKPDLTEEVIAESKDRIRKVIEDFSGEFSDEVEGWGKRRLAYPIEDYLEGLYSLWNFKGGADTVQELDRVIKLSDKFLRHIIIRLDE